MLSVLIPIYNYNVQTLVSELQKQLTHVKVPFEIICIDDASNDSFKDQNKSLGELDGCRLIKLEKNIGRAAIRNMLAQKAQFDYLLFMDCDSAVVSDDYIFKYLQHKTNAEIIVGGRVYAKKAPRSDLMLHWKYGTKRESILAKTRNRNIYKSFMTNNFLIQKRCFETLRFNEDIKGYGHEDSLFGLQAKQMGFDIQHIDNPLLHVDVEKNEVFLDKSLRAVENLAELYVDHPTIRKEFKKHITLLAWYIKLKPMSFGFGILRLFNGLLKKQLLSSSPNLKLFDLYRLLHLESCLSKSY